MVYMRDWRPLPVNKNKKKEKKYTAKLDLVITNVRLLLYSHHTISHLPRRE